MSNLPDSSSEMPICLNYNIISVRKLELEPARSLMSCGLKLGIRGVCSDEKPLMIDYILPKQQRVSRFAVPRSTSPTPAQSNGGTLASRFASLAEKFDGIITTTLKALWTDLADGSKTESIENNILAVAFAVLKVLRSVNPQQLTNAHAINVSIPAVLIQQPAFEAACRLAVSLALMHVGTDSSKTKLRLLPSACCDTMGVPSLVEKLYDRSGTSAPPLLVLVVDVGSLQTTASVVLCRDVSGPELVATQADVLGCGGDAIDQALLHTFLSQHQDAFIAKPLTSTSKQLLTHKMRAAKESVFAPASPAPSSPNRRQRKTVDVDMGGGETATFTVTEEAVNEIASDTIFRKVGALCSSVVALAANSHKLLDLAGKSLAVDAVVMTGGCSHIPLVRKFVEDLMRAMAQQAALGAAVAAVPCGVHFSPDRSAHGASLISASCQSLIRGPFRAAPPSSEVPTSKSTVLILLHGDCWGVLLPAGSAYPAVCFKRLGLRSTGASSSHLHGVIRLLAVSSDHREVVLDTIDPLVLEVSQPSGGSSSGGAEQQLQVDVLAVLDASGVISLSVTHAASGLVTSSVLGPFAELAAPGS